MGTTWPEISNNSTTALTNSTLVEEEENDFESFLKNNAEITRIEIPKETHVTLSSVSVTVSILGLGLNMLSLIVLCKRKGKTSTEIMFIGLTVCDLLYLLNETIYQMTTTLATFDDSLRTQVTFLYIVFIADCIYASTKLSSGLLVTSMTIERNFAIFNPLHFRTIWTPSVGRVATVLSTVLSPAVVTSMMLGFGTQFAVLFNFAFVALTGIVVTASNIATVFGLTRSRKFAHEGHSQNTQRLEKEKRQTKLLVGISFLYLGSVIILFVDSIVLVISEQEEALKSWSFICYIVNVLWGITFSMCNTIIFVVLNERYREQFFNLLPCGYRWNSSI